MIIRYAYCTLLALTLFQCQQENKNKEAFVKFERQVKPEALMDFFAKDLIHESREVLVLFQGNIRTRGYAGIFFEFDEGMMLNDRYGLKIMDKFERAVIKSEKFNNSSGEIFIVPDFSQNGPLDWFDFGENLEFYNWKSDTGKFLIDESQYDDSPMTWHGFSMGATRDLNNGRWVVFFLIW